MYSVIYLIIEYIMIRKDKLKNKSKVIKEVLKDPLATQREVAKKAGVGLWTANRILQELEQNGTESQILDGILQNDDKIIALSNGITYDTIVKNIESWDVSLPDTKIISDLANNSTKRKAIFWDTWDKDKTVQFILS